METARKLQIVPRPALQLAKKSKNPNHPKEGDSITVDPIRTMEDIAEIKDYLKGRPRDFALFVTGINTNLRASDLVTLTVGQVRGMKPRDTFRTREQKTSKMRLMTMNQAVYEAIQPLIYGPDDSPLFKSAKGGGKLTVPAVNKLVKGWCRDCGLKGNFGSHTLRKTFGSVHYHFLGTDLAVLQQAFNHSSQRQTLKYIGIQEENVTKAFMQNI